MITSEDGDVDVSENRFGKAVVSVEIESAGGECESEDNRPRVVDEEACQGTEDKDDD